MGVRVSTLIQSSNPATPSVATNMDPKVEQYTGEDFMSNLNNDSLHNVLSYLNIKDLVALSRTSKTLKQNVQQYCLHYIQSYSRLEKLQQFSKCDYLTIKENLDKEKITKILNEDEVTLKSSMKLFKFVQQYAHNYFRRFGIVDAESFPHLGNPAYIIREHYPPLGRNVVRLITVCWLHFYKILPEIPPGKYRISLHFEVMDELNWPDYARNNQNDTILQICGNDYIDHNRAGHIFEEISFHPKHWDQIRKNQFNEIHQHLNGKGFVHKSHGNWFFVEFRPIEISKETNLHFVWKDIDNPWWKGGMRWDFIEVKSV